MTEENNSGGRGINRRTVLKSAAAVSAAGFVGVPAFSGSAVAQSEILYLLETDTNTSEIYEVTIDDQNTEANTEHLASLPGENYKASAAIAATPDGSTLYFIDRDSDHLGKYEVGGALPQDLGELSNAPGRTVQLTFAPDGTLYAGSNDTDKLYTVDIDGMRFEPVTSGSSGVDMNGADIAFDNLGNLYLYTNDNNSLYSLDPETGVASKLGDSGPKMTGLGVLDGGAGKLLGSQTKSEELIEVDKANGDTGTGYDLKGDLGSHTYGDLTVGRLCRTSLELCAGQDTTVGTVTVADDGGTLQITYEMDPEAGWLLHETHVDIGDESEDFHTNKGGNPKVGQFDLSMEHDGVTSHTYTVSCDDDALSDVGQGAEKLFIAAHAVVQPTDGCVDFGVLEPGDSVEGLGTVNPVLDIQSGYDDGQVVVGVDEAVDSNTPLFYGSDDTANKGGGRVNGCLDPAGFADLNSIGPFPDEGRPHKYLFSVAEGVSLTEFELRMLDFGDYNPTKNGRRYAKMVARDADGKKVNSHELEFWTDEEVIPTNWYDNDPSEDGVTANDTSIKDAGDACNADPEKNHPGNWLWSVSGDGIVEIELTFAEGHDPNIGFTDLCFTASDETAWVCEEDGTGFEGSNWARYFEYDTCAPFDECGGGDGDSNGGGPPNGN